MNESTDSLEEMFLNIMLSKLSHMMGLAKDAAHSIHAFPLDTESGPQGPREVLFNDLKAKAKALEDAVIAIENYEREQERKAAS